MFFLFLAPKQTFERLVVNLKCVLINPLDPNADQLVIVLCRTTRCTEDPTAEPGNLGMTDSE